mmetsp:Transcript_8884/g.21438  ORF Transcript_8884/g.21438 Transcript_8884/m.21438 type:complete len:225 (+) Transcript_8884:609-1283(+)
MVFCTTSNGMMEPKRSNRLPPVDAKAAASLGPSRSSTTGMISAVAAREMHANRLMSSRTLRDSVGLCSRDSSELSTMYFFEITFRDWNARFDPMAVRNPYHVNERSVAEAMMTPATIGTNVSITGSVGTLPRKTKESTTVKNGSRDLMVCVRDTFTAPRDMFVVTNPRRCSTESGKTASTVRRLKIGACLTRSNQAPDINTLATIRWIAVHVVAYGKTCRACLL